MSGLPPLGNLLAMRLATEEDRQRARKALPSLYARVWNPHPDWIAAAAPLTDGGDPMADRLIGHGLLFAEGRHAVLGSSAPSEERMRSVRDIADRRPADLDSLPGDFTFLAFGRAGEVTAVRSCSGRVPVYYFVGDGCVAVATQLRRLCDFAGVPRRLDPLTNGLWLSGIGAFPDGRSPVTGVRVLPRGTSVRLPAPAAPVRYWRPERDTLTDDPTAPERLRESLLATLGTELDDVKPNLLTLSGGVDSSSLAALAARLGKPLTTLSLIPPVSAPGERRRDLHYLEILAQDVQMQEHRFDLDELARLSYSRESYGRVAFHTPHPALQLLSRFEDRPVTLVGGEDADLVCGSGLTQIDWMDNARLIDVARGRTYFTTRPRAAVRLVRGRRDLRTAGAVGPYRLRHPGWLTAEVREECDAWVANRSQQFREDRAPLRGLRMHLEANGYLAMNWEAASEHGVRRVVPFVAREVLEIAHGAHPYSLVGPGTKKLLQKALTGWVPRENLYRSDKGLTRTPAAPPQPVEQDLPALVQPLANLEWLERARRAPVPIADLVSLAQIGSFAQALSTFEQRIFNPGDSR